MSVQYQKKIDSYFDNYEYSREKSIIEKNPEIKKVYENYMRHIVESEKKEAEKNKAARKQRDIKNVLKKLI